MQQDDNYKCRMMEIENHSLTEHHSNNYCRQISSVDTKISGQK